MDADALLKKIENVVESPAAASAPMAVAPINWGVARRQLSRASSRIRRAGAPNGVHEGVLFGVAPTKKAKKRKSRKAQLAAAGRKGARVRAEKKAVRERAAKKGAKTRAENKRIRKAAARKAARTRAKGHKTTRRKHGKK